uniref:Aminoglycoside phosphotransferase n=1 Tax=mine drainage metagenome TaxID=410659 RepID=E6PYK5_9ZZZZ
MSEAQIDDGGCADALARYGLPGELSPHGSGHIHGSWLVTQRSGAGVARFLLQRMNEDVFRDVAALMENVERVTGHLATAGDARSLELVKTVDGKNWHRDRQGRAWRLFPFLESTRSVEVVCSTDEVLEASRAFGEFQRRMMSLPGPRLREVLPGFHDTSRRFGALREAVEADGMNHAGAARREIDFAFERAWMADVLARAGLPERIAHNDTKLNNVLLDERTGRRVCVIDLDTVMEGASVHDFGDMARTMTCAAAEDERDLARVRLEMAYFEALTQGYWETAGDFLLRVEIDLLAFSGRLMTLETGVRFLTDFLSGDRYYRTHRAGQNLDRCRTQFALLRSMEEQEAAMERAVRAIAG